MTVNIEFWQLVTLLLAFFGFVFGAGKVLLTQIDRRLNERFAAMEESRAQSARHWDERFGALMDEHRRDADGWKGLERDFLRFQADLPLQYVRREDYVRNQTVIEAKLDAVAVRLENLQLKGARNER